MVYLIDYFILCCTNLMPDTWQIAHTVIFLIYIEWIVKITVPNVSVTYSNKFYISVEMYKTFALCGRGAVQYSI